VALPRHLPAIDLNAREHSPIRYALTVLALLERYRQPEPWWAEAACCGEGSGGWFPDLHQKGTPVAPAGCARCPLADECREAPPTPKAEGGMERSQ